MMKHSVHNAGMALAYLTDCTLATVCDLATKKSASKSELRRQISMAQTAIDWMQSFKVDISTTRAADVVAKYRGSVAEWSDQWKTPNVRAKRGQTAPQE